MRASGNYGELRHGYQRAATLGAWTMTLSRTRPHVYVFESVVVAEDDYWATQAPLDLVLALGSAEWIWRGVEPQRTGARVAITLGEAPIVAPREARQAAAQAAAEARGPARGPARVVAWRERQTTRRQ